MQAKQKVATQKERPLCASSCQRDAGPKVELEWLSGTSGGPGGRRCVWYGTVDSGRFTKTWLAMPGKLFFLISQLMI